MEPHLYLLLATEPLNSFLTTEQKSQGKIICLLLATEPRTHRTRRISVLFWPDCCLPTHYPHSIPKTGSNLDHQSDPPEKKSKESWWVGKMFQTLCFNHKKSGFNTCQTWASPNPLFQQTSPLGNSGPHLLRFLKPKAWQIVASSKGMSGMFAHGRYLG